MVQNLLFLIYLNFHLLLSNQNLIMRKNLERPFLPHHPHLHLSLRNQPMRQKSLTVTPFLSHQTPGKSPLPAFQNLDALKGEQGKPKIQFNYSPSTPKFGQEDNSSIKGAYSPPKTTPITIDQTLETVKTPPNNQTIQEIPLKATVETLQFSKTILIQRKLNASQLQKRKQAKSKTLNNKYETITQVVPTLEDSRNQRDEQMIALRRELNETRSLNNQLRTDVLRWQKKFEGIEEKYRKTQEQLIQQVKQLKIQLQKAQNQKLLAEVSEAELQKKIKKMMQEAEQREKIQKIRDDMKLKPFRSQNERSHHPNISYQPYIQLF